MKWKLTTFLGALAVGSALVGGVSVVVARLVYIPVPPDFQVVFLWETGLSLGAKCGLFLTGLMLMMRSRLAAPVLLLTLGLSLAHSILVGSMIGPMPEGLSPAERAGQALGRAMGLGLAPVLYAALLGYLFMRRTQAEFASVRSPAEHSADLPE
jgi:hypothetical protein